MNPGSYSPSYCELIRPRRQGSHQPLDDDGTQHGRHDNPCHPGMISGTQGNHLTTHTFRLGHASPPLVAAPPPPARALRSSVPSGTRVSNERVSVPPCWLVLLALLPGRSSGDWIREVAMATAIKGETGNQVQGPHADHLSDDVTR